MRSPAAARTALGLLLIAGSVAAWSLDGDRLPASTDLPDGAALATPVTAPLTGQPKPADPAPTADDPPAPPAAAVARSAPPADAAASDTVPPPDTPSAAAARPAAAEGWTTRPAATLGSVRTAARTGPAGRPARLQVPAAGIDAAIVAVGTTPDGLMEVPADVGTAGWYRHGAAPDRAGATVIAGHVDSRTQGRGAFFTLTDVAAGDRVTVTLGDGSRRDYVVHDVRRIDKDDLPVGRLFRRAGPPALHLVTCGGPFDAAAGSYRSNVVVTAVPTPA